MLGMWDVGDMGCSGYGISGCGMFEMCDVQVVECPGCGMLGMWDIQYAGCSRCEMLGMWDVRDVRDVGCGMLIYKMPIWCLCYCIYYHIYYCFSCEIS